MPPPPSVEDAVQALTDVYRRAEARVNAELQDILTDSNQGNRIRRLRALQREMERRTSNLEHEARAFLNNSLPFAWEQGARQRAVGEFTWTQAHRQALGRLALDNFESALAVTRNMTRDVKAMIRLEGAQAARFKVATGETAVQAGRQLERRLLSMGISAITYADGRNIRASTYTEMLMRTATALAYNEGGLNQLVGDGIQFVEMIDGADCGLVAHDDAFKVDGKVLPVEIAAQYPISHPNCRRDFTARPDVRSDAEAAVSRSFRSDDQRADQTNFERYLAEKSQRRQTRLAREARRARAPRQPRTPRGTLVA